MTQSASTPRLRATLLAYLLLLFATPFVGATAVSPAADIALRAIGLLLVAFACLGRIWCSTFIAGQKDAALVQVGPYSIVRHPLYALSFVAACGLALATRSLLLGAITVVLIAALLARAARAEERFLAQQFAADWPRYTSTTDRWRPRFDSYRVPEQVSLRPGIFWKAFLDAGAMLLLFAVIDGAASLRLAGLTPKLVALP